MVRLNKIYTKTGDDGTTALGSGARVKKFDLRVNAYGTVDELNATLGIVCLYLHEHKDLHQEIKRIQNDLFDLGADLCTPDTGEDLGYEPLRIIQSQVDWIEAQIDRHNEKLEPLKSFILPGGSEAAAHLHLSRTICRRAERLVVECAHIEEEKISQHVITYLNRLSDYLFVIGRIANNEGRDDILWVPGSSR